jgi:hypothetical protein
MIIMSGKQSFIILLLIFFGVSCSQQESANEKSGEPDIAFETENFDLGTLKHGEKVEYVFYFENTGNGNLIIKDIITHCGCTTTGIEKQEYKPGEQGKIKIMFDTQGFRNNQTKITEVITNAKDSVKVLQLTAFIESDYQLINTTNK